MGVLWSVPVSNSTFQKGKIDHNYPTGHCAYVNASLGLGSCTAEGNGTFGYEFMPLSVILSDTPPPYKQDTEFIVPPSTFKDSIYDGNTSRAGFYIIFIGSLAAVLAFILYVSILSC